MTAISKFPFLFILSFSVFSSILINPPQPNLIIKPRLLYLPINILVIILSYSHANPIITSLSLSYLVPMQRSSSTLPLDHGFILFPCKIHLLYLPIIILSYSYAQNAPHNWPRNTFNLTPLRTSVIAAGGGKPHSVSGIYIFEIHLPSLQRPSTGKALFDLSFSLLISPNKPTYYYRYYYLEGRQPRWSPTYATCMIKDRRKLGGHKTTDVQITSELEPSGQNCMEATT